MARNLITYAHAPGFAALVRTAALAAALAYLLLSNAAWPNPARAEGEIEIITATAVSEFPEGFRFNLEISSGIEIDEIKVNFEIAGRAADQYNYLEIEQAENGSTRASLVSGEYFHRTNTRDRYSPPGTIIIYSFEITDVEGNLTITDSEELIYMDARFEWETVTQGPVTTFFHGPVGVRATDMTQVALDTLANMGPLLGAEVLTPLRIMMYNNTAEMLGALSARSSAISRELITEGQAFGEQNVVLLLGNGRRAGGTISHELVHVLLQRATANSNLPVPLWMNEGLAEYGNVDQGIAYDRFLEWAVDTNRATPFESLNVFPGDPNLNLVAYGQSRSVVEYIIAEFGRDKMFELMAVIDSGIPFDAAMVRTYGFDTRGLDELWRAEVGAQPLPDPERQRTDGESPTPEPTKTRIAPLTLESVAAAGAARTATPETESEPARSDQEDQAEVSPAPESTSEVPGERGTSGGCSAPGHGGGPPEAASAGLLLMPFAAFAWLRLRRGRFPS